MSEEAEINSASVEVPNTISELNTIHDMHNDDPSSEAETDLEAKDRRKGACNWSGWRPQLLANQQLGVAKAGSFDFLNPLSRSQPF